MEVKIITNEGISKKEKYEDWQLKCWADTLREAEEIKADPAKMAAIAPKLESSAKVIKSLDDIRKAAKEAVIREENSQDGYADEDKVKGENSVDDSLDDSTEEPDQLNLL